MSRETQTDTVWAVATDDESQWLVTLGDLWQARTQAGWQFVKELQAGIDAHGKRRDKSELYELAANQTGLSVKTLMNYASLARNPNSALAEDLGLDIAHADIVRGLDYDEAAALLTQAAEQSLSSAALGAVIRESRIANVTAPNLPDAGNENNLHDVPFDHTKPNVLYEEADYSADAIAYAGDVDGYEFDAETDSYTYTLDEVTALIQRATHRLRDVDHGQQRTVNEWLRAIENHTY